MLLLSDCPERLGRLVRVEDGEEVAVDSLAPGERDLWRALGTRRRAWRGHARDPGPPGLWSRAVVLAEAESSQFDAVREALASGLVLPGPVACFALTGRGFHGQHGRPWQSAPGNLHLCAALPAPGLGAREAGLLPMLPALALVDAIRALSGGALQPGIKWVNDVLVEGRKLGGVLTATQIQGDRVSAVVLGIGLNVAMAPTVPPTPFVPAVGCLADAGAGVTWDETASAVLAALGRRTCEVTSGGMTALLDSYREASLVVGRDVCVFGDPEHRNARVGAAAAELVHRGTVREIAADLSLLVEGAPAPIASGRLAFAEDCPGDGAKS